MIDANYQVGARYGGQKARRAGGCADGSCAQCTRLCTAADVFCSLLSLEQYYSEHSQPSNVYCCNETNADNEAVREAQCAAASRRPAHRALQGRSVRLLCCKQPWLLTNGMP